MKLGEKFQLDPDYKPVPLKVKVNKVQVYSLDQVELVIGNGPPLTY